MIIYLLILIKFKPVHQEINLVHYLSNDSDNYDYNASKKTTNVLKHLSGNLPINIFPIFDILPF